MPLPVKNMEEMDMADKYTEMGIEDFDDFITNVMNEGDVVKEGKYGFVTERVAFAPHGEPASIQMYEYNGIYAVCFDNEYDRDAGVADCFEEAEDDLFATYEEAEAYFNLYEGKGMKSGKEQIEECKKLLKYPQDVWIGSRCDAWGRVTFDVSYQGMLLGEYIMGIDPEKLKAKVDRYWKFRKETGIWITNIVKERREWNSNQRYYIFTYSSGRCAEKNELKVHIPSVLQGRERWALDLLDDKKIEEMKKMCKKDEMFDSRGQVKWYNKKKGYGVIYRTIGDYEINEETMIPEYFVHHSELTNAKSLKEGECVRFNAGKNGKKLVALQVEKDKKMKAECDPRCRVAGLILEDFGIKFPLLDWIDMEYEDMCEMYRYLKAKKDNNDSEAERISERYEFDEEDEDGFWSIVYREDEFC